MKLVTAMWDLAVQHILSAFPCYIGIHPEHLFIPAKAPPQKQGVFALRPHLICCRVVWWLETVEKKLFIYRVKSTGRRLDYQKIFRFSLWLMLHSELEWCDWLVNDLIFRHSRVQSTRQRWITLLNNITNWPETFFWVIVRKISVSIFSFKVWQIQNTLTDTNSKQQMYEQCICFVLIYFCRLASLI